MHTFCEVRQMRRFLTVTLACGLFVGVAAADEPTADSGRVILDTNSFWRSFLVLRDPVFGTSQDAKPLVPEKPPTVIYSSKLPPADWVLPGFDDSSWRRAPGPFAGGYGARQHQGWTKPESIALICLRGKFTVLEPEKVKRLRLSTAFRGGMVVYLNGREVARSYLPAGNIDSLTLAQGYPFEAFSSPDGKVALGRWRSDREAQQKRLELRLRKLTHLELPVNLLRRGRNVLALEIHRSPQHPDSPGLQESQRGIWGTAGLLEVNLEAPGLRGIVPNVERAAGFQVWNADLLAGVFDADYGDANEPLRPLGIVAAQNGAFAAQVVVGSDQPIKHLHAEVSNLEAQSSRAQIPASRVEIRYPQPDGAERGATERYPHLRNVCRFDSLAESPLQEIPLYEKDISTGATTPRFGAVQPIWITVNVPADAAPGNYQGTLTIRADGVTAVEVPVHLHVSDWKLPDSQDFHTLADFIQSPDSVAEKYQVPLWSDRHFELMAKSFAELGKVGNKTLYIPLLCRTHFGNPQTMVRWIRQPDGTYAHDYRILDRYLDTALAHMGKPRVVALYVWERYTGPHGSLGTKDKPPTGWLPGRVSELDPVTGKVRELETPKYTTPEMKAFWQPVIQEIRARLEERGLGDAMMFGMNGDFSRVTKEPVELFKELAPGVPWVSQGHGLVKQLFGVPVGYATTVWNARFAVDPSIKRTHGWQREMLVAHFHRGMRADVYLTETRLMGEMNIQGSQRGFGRLGADFWPILINERGRRTPITRRYPQLATWGQLSLGTAFLAPGPEGAISTVRFELIREGIEECEARIFIERALLDEGLRTRLGVNLATECQALLDERTRIVQWSTWHAGNYEYFLSSDWQERSRKLYDTAARVARALNI